VVNGESEVELDADLEEPRLEDALRHLAEIGLMSLDFSGNRSG